MGKGGKKRAAPRYEPDDSYRRTKIGFTADRTKHGLLLRGRDKRPSFSVEFLPDAEGILIKYETEEDYEDEEEDE